jgi:hypothetical protein
MRKLARNGWLWAICSTACLVPGGHVLSQSSSEKPGDPPFSQRGAPVYTTYLWHLQQPIYWPERSPGKLRYAFADESLFGSAKYPGHPLNDLAEIFGKDDRRAIYQWRAKESVASMGGGDAGAQLSYSGVLTENVSSLGKAGLLGYDSNWSSSIREAMNWKSSTGKPKLEVLGFSYHHALPPLIDPQAFKKELSIDRINWQKVWGANNQVNPPKGFRSTEEAFSIRMIKPLVEAGYEWVIVPNHHLARTHSNYQALHGKGLYDPPNRADQINPPAERFWSGEIDGRGATLSVPFSYQPHWAKYVDPENGKEYRIVVVPMGDILSYKDGYSPMDIGTIDTNIAPYVSAENPALVLFSHDGDNAWGGGFSYYHEAVPNFVNQARQRGYEPTTIQTFLDRHPPDPSHVVHVEDGAWVNAADDWGHPQFLNWLWYPQRDRRSATFNYNDPSTWADIENGWSEDFRNWAVITAGQNFVETADQKLKDSGMPVMDSHIQDPEGAWTPPNEVELAWHYYLAGISSCYMYYGTALDMEVKPSLAINQSVEFAQQALSSHKHILDRTAPSVFVPQRYPYNPGSINYGASYGYRSWVAPTDFYVWSFVHDISGVESVTLKVRLDQDGFNPIDNNDNETYAGGESVGEWQDVPMILRAGETFRDNIMNDPNVDFFIPANVIADQYWAKVTGFENQLIDYYVEAKDSLGNVKRSDIQHVFIGSGKADQ